MSRSGRKTKRQSYLGVKIVVGLIGLFLSITFHELFHIIMHWDQVPHVGLFPNHNTLAEIIVWIPNGYDMEGEEIAAYGITLLTILMTLVVIFRIHDATDTRSAGQILFPNDKRMQKMNPSEMWRLANFDDDFEPARPTTVRRKRSKK